MRRFDHVIAAIIAGVVGFLIGAGLAAADPNHQPLPDQGIHIEEQR